MLKTAETLMTIFASGGRFIIVQVLRGRKTIFDKSEKSCFEDWLNPTGISEPERTAGPAGYKTVR